MTPPTHYVIPADLHRKLVENERLQNEWLAQEVDRQAIPVVQETDPLVISSLVKSIWYEMKDES